MSRRVKSLLLTLIVCQANAHTQTMRICPSTVRFPVRVLGQQTAGAYEKALYVAKPDRPVHDIYRTRHLLTNGCIQKS